MVKRVPLQAAPQGKVFGILATRGVNRPPSPQDPFPGRTATFRDIACIGRSKGIYVCVFGPRNIDRRSGQVHAHFYVPGKGWVRHVIPVPRVVYNRVANRRVESRPRVQRLLRWLHNQGVTVFNPGFLDKWAVYDYLQADETLRANVPATELYNSPGQLVRLLQEWGTVYCKPRRGSLGTGIAALTLTAGGRVTIRRNGIAVGTQTQTLSGLPAVRMWARRRLRVGRVCLQRGIKMATVGGRRFDIRALVQKDETGQWRFTGAAARLAAHGALTTHVPRGGARMNLHRALVAVLHNKAQAQAVIERLATLTEAAAATLEQGLGEEYGEFSLDVGFDTDGQLWIFEMNAKPFRFDEFSIRKQAYRRLVEFAKYLVEHEEEECDK